MLAGSDIPESSHDLSSLKMTNHNLPVALHPSHLWHLLSRRGDRDFFLSCGFSPSFKSSLTPRRRFNILGELLYHRASLMYLFIFFIDQIPIFLKNHKLVFSSSSSFICTTRFFHIWLQHIIYEFFKNTKSSLFCIIYIRSSIIDETLRINDFSSFL